MCIRNITTEFHFVKSVISGTNSHVQVHFTIVSSVAVELSVGVDRWHNCSIWIEPVAIAMRRSRAARTQVGGALERDSRPQEHIDPYLTVVGVDDSSQRQLYTSAASVGSHAGLAIGA